jgi:uncharacterized protein (DUF2252 family)
VEKPANARHLSEPDYDDAMAMAGSLFHFVGGSKELRDRYARWMEHHEGDLDEHIVAWYLGRCHALLEPGCPEPLDADVHPGRTR